EIYRIGRDGSGLTRVTNNSIEDRQPDWSPDGATLVVSAPDAGGKFQLFSINVADGSNRTQITTLPGDSSNPSYSPLGDQIAFQNCIGLQPGISCQIVVRTVLSGATFFIPNDGWSDEQPEWVNPTPSDEFLIISSKSPEPGDTYHLYVMNMLGYLQWQITQDDALTDRDPSCCLSP
ncbi:MAG: TolB family protein, partial [bacterium]